MVGGIPSLHQSGATKKGACAPSELRFVFGRFAEREPRKAPDDHVLTRFGDELRHDLANGVFVVMYLVSSPFRHSPLIEY